MSSHDCAWACALFGLPPPRPLYFCNADSTHSSAFNCLSFELLERQLSGTTANTNTLPPLPGSSSLIPRNGRFGAAFFTALVIFCDVFASDPISTLVTTNGACAASASWTTTFTSLTIVSTFCCSSLAFASDAAFCMFSIRARNSALMHADIDAASKSLRTFPACLSRSDTVLGSNVSKLSIKDVNACPRSIASFAKSLVTAVIRRIPLATAVSSTTTKASAAPVLVMWVPPQNSTDVSVPIRITRTGSG